ncbi:unnamed protein product [Gongylonema pulchrum]|uniref:Uncharacterized protein n=1 Tax=Gongylonema pulchrum TaxID=637853 RepID=A0A183DMW4_9BILA|nr:unnamed protein product [Gongylonema pulchrum]
MNKYRVGGKQLLLKLAQPKYRAPKTPRYLQQQQAPACETVGYYAGTQVFLDTTEIDYHFFFVFAHHVFMIVRHARFSWILKKNRQKMIKNLCCF